MTDVAPVVVKYGGSLLEDPGHRDRFLRSVAALPRDPAIILVHGGGKEISRQMEEAGLQPHFVAGRRFTDAKTLGVVERALRDLNEDLVRRLNKLGCAAKGYSGRDQHLLEATSIAELGFVGLPRRVRSEGLTAILRESALPVFYPLAEDASGQTLNMNADDFALALAVACRASRLVFLTDTGGLVGTEGRLLPLIDEAEAERLIANGTITGGMTVKIRACMDALRKGVGAVELALDLSSLTEKTASTRGTRILISKIASQ